MNGRRNATTTARTVVRGICRRTKAKMWRTTMNNISALTKTQRIRELNDQLRRTFTGGKVMLTACRIRSIADSHSGASRTAFR
jgi:hypothetical protein